MASGIAGSRPDGADRLEVRVVGVDDVDHVDIVDDHDAVALGLAEQVSGQRVLADDDRRGDVLAPIDDIRGLQALGVQPTHVERQQLLELVGRQPRLRLGRQVLGDELDRLVDDVHRARRDRIEPACLAADDDSSDHERAQRGEHDEDERDGGHLPSP